MPADVTLSGDIAMDTETKGLMVGRDRLCVVQLSDGNGDAHLVQLTPQEYDSCKNLKALLGDSSRQIICHYARFDVATVKYYLGVDINTIFCTKIASKLCRTYTDRHGLKELLRELLEVDVSKEQQSSNWAQELTQAQQQYAANDVLYLHRLRETLTGMLQEESRLELAQQCFDFLPTRVELDLAGWNDQDIFRH